MKINKCDSKYSLNRQFVITLGTFSSLEKLVACPVMVTELYYNSKSWHLFKQIQKCRTALVWWTNWSQSSNRFIGKLNSVTILLLTCFMAESTILMAESTFMRSV